MKEKSIEDIIEKAIDCLEDARESSVLLMYDAALNRAYYAMFHSVQALLATKGIHMKSHSGSHNAFHKEFILPDTIKKDHGVALKRVFEKRQFSDYDYEEIQREDAVEAFNDAERFILASIQYLKENNHLQ